MPDLLPVPDMLIGQRFDAGLSKMMGISRSKAASLIDGRQVKILGKETDKSCRLAANDIIELSLEERKEKREPVSKLLKTDCFGNSSGPRSENKRLRSCRATGNSKPAGCGHFRAYARMQIRSGLSRNAQTVFAA